MVYALNLFISFILELAMLAAFACFGFHIGASSWLQYGLGIGLPAVVIIFWTKKMAPKAMQRFSYPLILILTLVLFELAALALYSSGVTKWGAAIFALVALINVGLRFLLGDQET